MTTVAERLVKELEIALPVLIDIASRWGENSEEGFSRCIYGTDSIEECAEVAKDSNVELDDVLEVRNLWRAVEVATAYLSYLSITRREND